MKFFWSDNVNGDNARAVVAVDYGTGPSGELYFKAEKNSRQYVHLIIAPGEWKCAWTDDDE